MTDRVDTSMEAVEAARPRATLDGCLSYAEGHQLPVGDHTVLALREISYLQVVWWLLLKSYSDLRSNHLGHGGHGDT